MYNISHVYHVYRNTPCWSCNLISRKSISHPKTAASFVQRVKLSWLSCYDVPQAGSLTAADWQMSRLGWREK